MVRVRVPIEIIYYIVIMVYIYIYILLVITYEYLQQSQKGVIGVTLVTHWLQPKYATVADVRASRRALDFMLGW